MAAPLAILPMQLGDVPIRVNGYRVMDEDRLTFLVFDVHYYLRGGFRRHFPPESKVYTTGNQYM
jgi:hypothetical protein